MKDSTAYRLLKYYLNHHLTDDTERTVQRWIITDGSEKEKETAAHDFWQELPYVTTRNTTNALKRVNKRIGQKHFTLNETIFKIAAVLIPFFVIAGYYLLHTSSPGMIRLVAGYGEIKQVILPDGSSVRLNAGSALCYSGSFGENERTVELSGEAWFEVEYDQQSPFVVKTENLSVNVLGTQFNLRAFPDENQIIVTLSSGKIRIDIPDMDSRMLNPDDQLIYDTQLQSVQIQSVESQLYSAWTTGALIFVEATLPEIVKRLERSYNVSIRIADIYNVERYNVSFRRDDPVEDVLSILSDLAQFSWSKKDNKIHIERK